MQVDEINDIHELGGWRLFWNLLLPQTRQATFFQSLDWLEVFWKHFGAGQRLRALVVRSDGQPVGILPLVVRSEPTRVGKVRVLTYPLNDWGTFYGPIGPNPTATLAAGMRHLRQTPRDWDLLDLRWIDRDGLDHGRTEAAMRRVGFHPRRQAWDRAPVVEMRRTWEEYWNSRTRKWRLNVRNCRRRILGQGKVTFLRYRPQGAARGQGDPGWDLFDECVKVSNRSWQGSSTNGTTLCHESIHDYIRDTHAAAARAGALDLALLLLDGQPAAFAYHYHYQGRVYGLRKGFDPAFSQLRPGTVLQQMVLEDSFRRGDLLYDMGVGSLAVKRHWQTSIRTSYRYTHFPAKVAKAQLLRMKRWIQEKIHGPQHVACAQTV